MAVHFRSRYVRAAWSLAYLLFVSESCLAHCRLKLWVNFLCRSEGSSSVRVGGAAVLLNRWLERRGASCTPTRRSGRERVGPTWPARILRSMAARRSRSADGPILRPLIPTHVLRNSQFARAQLHPIRGSTWARYCYSYSESWRSRRDSGGGAAASSVQGAAVATDPKRTRRSRSS